MATLLIECLLRQASEKSLLSLFYRQVDRDSQKLSDLLKVTQILVKLNLEPRSV